MPDWLMWRVPSGSKVEWAGADPTFLSQLSSPDRERRLHDCRCRNRAPTAAQYRLFPRRC